MYAASSAGNWDTPPCPGQTLYEELIGKSEVPDLSNPSHGLHLTPKHPEARVADTEVGRILICILPDQSSIYHLSLEERCV